MKKHWLKIFLIGLVVLAFVWRIWPLQYAHPFWIDEFSSGVQARIFLEHLDGITSALPGNVERNNFLTHSLIAVAFHFFGESEAIARLPFVIIGSLVPVGVFLVTQKVTTKTSAAVAASLLTAFSYFEITWSTQSRGYVLQQLLGLISIYIYFSFMEQKKFSWKHLIALMAVFTLGVLTHNAFLLLGVAFIIHAVLFYREKAWKILQNPLTIVGILIGIGYIYFAGVFTKILTSDLFRFYNNIWYYHSFFWRQYGLLIFLAIIGILFSWQKNRKESSLILLFTFLHGTFITFFFGHYIAKYTLPIFIYFLLFAGVGIFVIADALFKNFRYGSFPAVVLMTLFIIFNGHTFVPKPQAYYSVNHDTRDIAIIDYQQIYSLVKEKIKKSNNPIAVIDTWPDRTRWYLGNEFADLYYFHWENAGLRKTTKYIYNDQQEKIVPHTGVRVILELDDLKKAMQTYPQGFLYIDDSSLPSDVLNYAAENLYEELRLDSYAPELLENPYSRWPATLYSWGFETENPYYESSASGRINEASYE